MEINLESYYFYFYNVVELTLNSMCLKVRSTNHAVLPVCPN